MGMSGDGSVCGARGGGIYGAGPGFGFRTDSGCSADPSLNAIAFANTNSGSDSGSGFRSSSGLDSDPRSDSRRLPTSVGRSCHAGRSHGCEAGFMYGGSSQDADYCRSVHTNRHGTVCRSAGVSRQHVGYRRSSSLCQDTGLCCPFSSSRHPADFTAPSPQLRPR